MFKQIKDCKNCANLKHKRIERMVSKSYPVYGNISPSLAVVIISVPYGWHGQCDKTPAITCSFGLRLHRYQLPFFFLSLTIYSWCK